MKIIHYLNDMLLKLLENKEQTSEKMEEYEKRLRKKIIKVVCFFILALIALIILITQPSIFASLGAFFTVFISIIEMATNIIEICGFFKDKDK